MFRVFLKARRTPPYPSHLSSLKKLYPLGKKLAVLPLGDSQVSLPKMMAGC